MKLSYAIAARLKELLQEKEMTQYRLFKKCGVPQSTISTILHAKCKTVKVTTLCVLCQGLQMELCEFFRSALFIMAKRTDPDV